MGRARAARTAVRARETEPVAVPVQHRESLSVGLSAELRELCEVRQQRQELVLREVELVESARDRGASWRLLADALGVTQQAVQQRYGRLARGAGAR